MGSFPMPVGVVAGASRGTRRVAVEALVVTPAARLAGGVEGAVVAALVLGTIDGGSPSRSFGQGPSCEGAEGAR